MDPETAKQKTVSNVLPVSPKLGSQIKFKRYSYFVQLILRVLVIASTLTGAITMTTSDESVSFFGIVMRARYTYSTAFGYKVIADSVVCGLSVLSLVLVILLNRPKSNPKNYFYLLLFDLVSLLLLLSGVSAATAIGFVGQYGQKAAAWFPICNRVPKFCDKVVASIASSYLAVASLVVTTVISAHKLKAEPFLGGI